MFTKRRRYLIGRKSQLSIKNFYRFFERFETNTVIVCSEQNQSVWFEDVHYFVNQFWEVDLKAINASKNKTLFVGVIFTKQKSSTWLIPVCHL